ncbi:MAG: hypothetical protein VKS61_18495 [Candidatus Sericytochromatia bacterium]|nr:hypothetical protein [Candidatus Sericytochromatia bacterium]
MLAEVSALAVCAEAVRLMLAAYSQGDASWKAFEFRDHPMFGHSLTGRLKVRREGDVGTIVIWLQDPAGKLGHVGTLAFSGAGKGTLRLVVELPVAGVLALHGSADMARGETVLDLASFPDRASAATLGKTKPEGRLHLRQRLVLRRLDGRGAEPAFTYSSAFARAFGDPSPACATYKRVTLAKFLEDHTAVVVSREVEGGGNSATWRLDAAGTTLQEGSSPPALRGLTVSQDELPVAPGSAAALPVEEIQLFQLPAPPVGP